MKCEECGGTGKVQKWFYERTGFGKCEKVCGDVKCEWCNGTGEVEVTNEEWFDNLTTEEKAKVLRRKTYGNGEENEREEQGWVNWLKAKHEDNPPDIPSVPSWDKWLKGEKTKCELCDGSGKGAECNLVGRFECPKTPKTEQEYIQICTTEELANVFFEYRYINATPQQQMWLSANEDFVKGGIVEWLKQPHR